MKKLLKLIFISLFLFFVIFLQIHSSDELGNECKPYNETVQNLVKWLKELPAPFDYQNEERREMLLSIDELFLHPFAPKLPCVGYFFQSRVDAFLEDYMSFKITDGVAIWKLYNEAVVVKTASVTFAFDVHGGWEKIYWPDEKLYKFLDTIDVAFYSHNHGDHVDVRVIQYLIEKGKTVVTMPDFLLESTFPKKLTVVRNKKFEVAELSVIAYPGFQKETINNVYHITTPEGISIMHLGDENEINNFGNEWYRKQKEYPRVDVLLPNIWSPDLKNICDYFKPSLIVIMHEHELMHGVSGRRSYSFVYNVLEGLSWEKAYVLAWGEKIVIPKPFNEPSQNH